MEKNYKVFIPEPEWEESHKILEEIAEVKVGKPGVKYTEDMLLEEMKDVDAVIITSQQKITRRIIYNCPKLKVIVKYGSKPGIDNVDYDAANERGIVVCYTPGANSDSVAEHTIALMLGILKKLCYTSQKLRQGYWREKGLLGHELKGKTVGIIGVGTIGKLVAKKLQGFEAKLLGYDPYVSEEDVKDLNIELTNLEDLLRRSDIVTLHAILTDETYYMIGEKELKMMKPTAILVNTARGALINEKVLIKALQEGWMAGAALDVFEVEPPTKDNPLLKLENVLATPHFASCTCEAWAREAFMAAEEVVRVLEGYKPRFIANPEVLSKLNLKDEEK